MRLRQLPLFGGAIAVITALALPVCAREPVEPFLEGLRRRQMFDMAHAYLESLQTSKLVSPEVKQTIPYLQGQTLLEEARIQRDTGVRMKRLDEARQQFEAFIQAHPKHALAAGAGTQLGNILLERARTQLDLAKRPAQAARHDQLLAEARELFTKSQQVFDAAEAKYTEELAAFPKAIDAKDRAQVAARNAVRLNLLQAKLFAATVQFEAAKAYDRGGDEWKNLLTEAAGKFGKIYEANEKIIAGLFARMWQGRCEQELGNLGQAITFYEQLLIQPDSDEFRDLKRKALRYALECWVDSQQKKYDEAIRQGELWIKRARGQENLTAEGLAIRWFTALAYERTAAALKDADKQKALKAAADHAAVVAKHSGEFQAAAKEVATLSRKSEPATGEPANFADARTRAKSELDAMIAVDSSLKAAAANKSDADKVPGWQQERERSREAAMKYYRLALSLRDRESPLDAVNDCRYYLCFLNYDAGRYFDAAILGEFLARSYPQSSVARPGGKIALAAFLQAYNAAPADDRTMETNHLTSIAEYLGAQWPLEAEADEAWMVLSDVAIRAGDLAKAAEYLNRVRPDSPRRGEADLKAGQTLWSAYQNNLRLPVEQRPPAAELDQQLATAQQILERGAGQLRQRVADGGELNPTLLDAELALARVLVETSQSAAAVKLLEQPETGVLALIAAKNPLTERGAFVVEAYKCALRGYVGMQRLEDAERIMNALDEQSASSTDAAAILTRVYVGLGVELEHQLTRLREEKRTEDLARVSHGFELLLNRIAGREQGNTFSSLNWVAETYYRLAAGAAASNQEAAANYYGQAAAVYTRILDQAKREPSFASPAAQSAVRIRLAACQSGLGEYQQAIEQISAILAVNPNTLEAQVAAAETFQRWGAVDANYYVKAISGQPPAGGSKIDIWGWNKLALRLQKLPKYAELYRQARYNLVECSFLMAQAKSGKEKADGLNKAANLIEAMARIEPKMGGEVWRARFDELLKSIQRAAGRKADGLNKSAPPAGSSTTAGAAS